MRSLNTSAVESAFWPDITPLAAIVRSLPHDGTARPVAAERFAEAGRQRPQPEVYLRADQNVPYRYVAETLADASKAGLSKVAFVSEPAR